MANSSNVRLRIICLIDIFLLYTDEDHIISMQELCDKLKEYDIEADRRAILSDIKVLEQTYIEIVSVNKPKKGYYMVPHWDLDTIYLTLKAILSSNQITDEDCEQIIRHMRMHMCQETADFVFNATFVANERDTAFHFDRDITLTLRRAIQNGLMCEITYRIFNETSEFCDSWSEKTIRINPLKLVVTKRNLMLGFTKTTKDKSLYCIPLERITSIKAMRKPAEIPLQQDFRRATNFFTGETIVFSSHARWMYLKCKNEYLEKIYEFFPGNMQIKKSDEEGYFLAKIFTHFDYELMGWFGYMHNNVEILEPAMLKEIVEGMYGK